MKYSFTSLATGRQCCEGDDLKHLCTSCRAQANAASVSEAPPSLIAAIAARRGITPNPIPEPVIYGGGPRPRPTVAATAVVDDPPSLTEAITRRRSR